MSNESNIEAEIGSAYDMEVVYATNNNKLLMDCLNGLNSVFLTGAYIL